jgi:cytochrome c oxidase assembly protein subunit 15
MNSEPTNSDSPWPHRLAVVLACATFPLIWVGGLVTTTDAGMAVPDWPTTYGYNLLLYPWQTWLAGPWDLFVEHGHRLLASAVGMITIALLFVLWRKESRCWVRWLGVAALALVVFQGVLGGMRVLLDERTLAMLHGCTGPLFFALTVALAAFTSRRWKSTSQLADSPYGDKPGGSLIRRLAMVTAILAYLQIVVGAVMRHVPVETQPTAFVHAIRFHLVLATILALHIVALGWLVARYARGTRPLGRLAFTLNAFLLVQVLLGAGTWIVKFAVPAWAADWLPAQTASVQEGGWLQTHVITAHVATGSLILATSVALALYAQHLLPVTGRAQRVPLGKLGAAL